MMPGNHFPDAGKMVGSRLGGLVRRLTRGRGRSRERERGAPVDDEFDADDQGEPGVPLSVRLVQLAGVLWAGHGVLAVAAGLAMVVVAGSACLAGSREAGNVAAGVAIVLVGGPVLAVGIGTATGRAPGTLWGGVGSAALGVLAAGYAASLCAKFGPAYPAVTTSGGLSVALLVPGVLAFAGRRDYLAWRASRDPPTR